MLVRPRLLAALRRRWVTPVVSVVAGAGYGKSTLLAQAVADNDADPAGVDARVTCTAESSVASVFAGSLADALGVAPPSATSPTALAQAVAETVAGHTPVPVCIVIDDLHLLAGGSGGAAMLVDLVEQMPSNGRIVLASRLSLPHPLTEVAARGPALRLTEEDLAFTDDELYAFAGLRGVDGARLSGAGGWPAIAELSASADGPVVDAFLWKELLDTMDPGRRRVLSALAAIGGSDQDGLTAALGEPADPVAAVVDLPLATIADDGRVYLHALWSEPLAAELTDHERRTIRRQAAVYAFATGDRLAAFRLFADAAEWPGALSVIRDTCTPFVPPLGLDVLDDWLAAVEAAVPDAPEVLLLRGVLLLARRSDLAEASRLLEASRLAFRDRDEIGELASIVHQFSLAFLVRDGLALATAMLEIIGLAERGCVAAGPLAAIGRAGVAVAGDDNAGALRELDAVGVEDLDSTWWALRSWMYGEQLLALGRAREARDCFEVEYPYHDAIRERLDDGLLRAAFIGGDPDRTSAIIEELLARAAAGHRPPQALWALIARIQAHLGSGEEAIRSLEAARSSGPPVDVTAAVRIQTAMAAIAIAQGDEATARRAFDEVEGTARLVLLRYPVVPYVLDEAARAPWDEAQVGPALHEAHQLARALVGIRERGDLRPVRSLPSLAPGPVRTALPLPWAAELAVAAEAVGRPDARALVASLGARARPWIERLHLDADEPLASSAKRLLTVIPAVPAVVTEVRLLGSAELVRGPRPDDSPGWRRRRVRELLAFLATHDGAPRDQISDALWPDLTGTAAANNLRVNLTHLLRVLEPDRTPNQASYFLAHSGSSLSLRGHDRLRIDVWDLARHLDDGRRADASGTPTTARDAYLAAVACWRGPFLGGASPLWAAATADRLQQAFVAAVIRAGELSLAAGDTAQADSLARQALETDPWSEPAFQVLIAVRLAVRDTNGAREALVACRSMLTELGVAPSRETTMIERRITVAASPPADP